MDHHRQEPTHSELRIVSSGDAKAALFLAEAGILHLVRRRPDDSEKTHIGHGSVFIWRDGVKGETGLERWTDGRQWGPSRCRDDFLIYEEKDGPFPRLVKSTFTARRNTVDDNGALWHLIAYYYQQHTATLRAPDTDPEYAPIVAMMPSGYFVSNRKDKSRKAKEVPLPVSKVDFSRLSLSSPHASSSSTQSSASPISPFQPPRHRQYDRPQLSLLVPPCEATVSAVPCKSTGLVHPHQDPCLVPNLYHGSGRPGRNGSGPRAITKAPTYDYNFPGPYAPRSGGGSGDGSSSDLYSSSPSPSPGLSPASSGLSPVDRLDELVLNPNGGTLHQPATARSNNGYSHLGARKQTGTSGSPIVYRKSCTPFSNASNGSTASVSPTTGNNVVFLPSIIDTVARVGEDLLIENVEGSTRMVEDEKQLQKLNTSLAHLF